MSNYLTVLFIYFLLPPRRQTSAVPHPPSPYTTRLPLLLRLSSTASRHVLRRPPFLLLLLLRPRPLRRLHKVAGGARINFGRRQCAAGPKQPAGGGGAIWLAQFSNVAYFFQKNFSKNLICYKNLKSL